MKKIVILMGLLGFLAACDAPAKTIRDTDNNFFISFLPYL